MAAKAASVFKEHGATHIVECWGDDVPDGKVTDFKRRREGRGRRERGLLAGSCGPSKEARDLGNKKVMQDARMQPGTVPEMPFDGKRMIFGGFELLMDTAA